MATAQAPNPSTLAPLPGADLFAPHSNPPPNDEGLTVQQASDLMRRGNPISTIRRGISALRYLAGARVISPEAFLFEVDFIADTIGPRTGDPVLDGLNREIEAEIEASRENTDGELRTEPYRTHVVDLREAWDRRAAQAIVETLFDLGEHALAIWMDSDPEGFSAYCRVGRDQKHCQTEVEPRDIPAFGRAKAFPLDPVIGIPAWQPPMNWVDKHMTEWSGPDFGNPLDQSDPFGELARTIAQRWLGGYFGSKPVWGQIEARDYKRIAHAPEDDPIILIVWFADTRDFVEFFITGTGHRGKLDIVCHSREAVRNPVFDLRRSLAEMHGVSERMVQTFVHINRHDNCTCDSVDWSISPF